MSDKEFDVSQFEAKDSAWLEVQNKKDDGPLLVAGKPVRILVRSPGTREALQAQHKIDAATQTRTFAALRGKASKDTVDTKLEQSAEKLVAVTVEIENFPVAPAALYGNPKLGYISDQVTKYHGDWGNF